LKQRRFDGDPQSVGDAAVPDSDDEFDGDDFFCDEDVPQELSVPADSAGGIARTTSIESDSIETPFGHAESDDSVLQQSGGL
jgi:hypothetical protein